MMKALRYVLLKEPFIPSREEGIQMLENLLGVSVREYFEELEQTELFKQHKARESEMKAKKLGIIDLDVEAKMLYAIVRVKKPEKLLETGVGVGISTSIILKALEKNGSGHLISIDDGRIQLSELGLGLGCYIPNSLKHRWELRIGLARNLIPDIGAVDFFLQDTEHSFENVSNELMKVWPLLSKGGVIFVDDINYSNGFRAFCLMIGFKLPQSRFDRFSILAK